MLLYHYTGLEMLRGIGQHGLTVGDVPTDIRRMKGVIGVWLTSSDSGEGHGLEESAVNKKRAKLIIDVSAEDPKLAKWDVWSRSNVTPETISALEHAGGQAADSWYIYFGWIKPGQILKAVDTSTGDELAEWATSHPQELSRPGIPYWRRAAWQKKMLNDVRKSLRLRSAQRLS